MVRDCKARDAIVPSNLAGTVQILWVILIGSVAGVIAKFITPGENEPMGSSSPRYLELWNLGCNVPRTNYRLVRTRSER